MVVSLVIGIAVGGLAAAGPPAVSAILLSATDFALGLPRVVLLLLLASLWTPSATLVIVVLGITGWMPIARLVYAELRSQLVRPYVESAVALGSSRTRVLLRHALPHALAPVVAAATLGVGQAITLEAGLSFLGVGVQPPAASWGTMIASGRDTVVNAPWVGLAPGVALVLVVVACTLLADAVQDRRLSGAPPSA
jgi:peptide/nickel transport system permease protein